jgi:hypothetical protein
VLLNILVKHTVMRVDFGSFLRVLSKF